VLLPPIPAPPKEKAIRPAREMMKNVQGSSAGAGSGEFHVYKASRRREYERLKALNDGTEKESVERQFEEKKRQREEEAEAKTAKNRAKRQKKKERAKAGKSADGAGAGPRAGQATGTSEEQVLKKRRVVNGKEVVFRRPGEESDEEDEGDGGINDDDDEEPGPRPVPATAEQEFAPPSSVPVAETPTIVIHEDD